MTFGDAIEALKQGARVTRAGWNGRGMWLALTPGSTVLTQGAALRGAALHRSAEVVAERGDLAPHPVTIAPHIDLRAADGTLVIGWLASQTDLLAEDWSLCDQEPPWAAWLCDAAPRRSQQRSERAVLIVPDQAARADAVQQLGAAVHRHTRDLTGFAVGHHAVSWLGRGVAVLARGPVSSSRLLAGERFAHVWSIGEPGRLDDEARSRIRVS